MEYYWIKIEYQIKVFVKIKIKCYTIKIKVKYHLENLLLWPDVTFKKQQIALLESNSTKILQKMKKKLNRA